MKILQANAGALTNFEVLDFLRSRGAGKDPTRLIASVAPSEYKVYDYLEQTAACNQTRDIIHELLDKCKSYDLTKAEILNIINIRPSSPVEIDPIIQACRERFGEGAEELVAELVETVTQILPSPPTEMETNEDVGLEKEETPDGQQEEVMK